MAALAALEKKLRDLPDDAFHVFTASKTPPTEEEIDAIEAKTGIPVPKALPAFLRREGVAKLRAASADIDALMETGRKAKWAGPSGSDVVDAVKKQPKEALARHLPELAKTLLPPGTLSMGCLDIIEAAGAEAFPSVAK